MYYTNIDYYMFTNYIQNNIQVNQINSIHPHMIISSTKIQFNRYFVLFFLWWNFPRVMLFANKCMLSIRPTTIYHFLKKKKNTNKSVAPIFPNTLLILCSTTQLICFLFLLLLAHCEYISCKKQYYYYSIEKLC